MLRKSSLKGKNLKGEMNPYSRDNILKIKNQNLHLSQIHCLAKKTKGHSHNKLRESKVFSRKSMIRIKMIRRLISTYKAAGSSHRNI